MPRRHEDTKKRFFCFASWCRGGRGGPPYVFGLLVYVVVVVELLDVVVVELLVLVLVIVVLVEVELDVVVVVVVVVISASMVRMPRVVVATVVV